MPSHSNGKNVSIHFTQDELTLLDEFEKYRKQNYINRSGWVKQHMQKELRENRNPMLLSDMKTYRISAVHAEMLKTLSRKLRMKEEEVIEEMIQERYNKKK